MKFKRLERVEIKVPQDYGKIVKIYPKTKEYLVIPEGSDQHWLVKESELISLK